MDTSVASVASSTTSRYRQARHVPRGITHANMLPIQHVLAPAVTERPTQRSPYGRGRESCPPEGDRVGADPPLPMLGTVRHRRMGELRELDDWRCGV